MALNTDDSFSLLAKIKHDFVSNPLGGELDWAGDTVPFFNIPPELYELTGAIDHIKWDDLGLAIATQTEYDDFAAILYGISDYNLLTSSSSSSGAPVIRNFLDNLAIFNAWLMVNVYPPANLLDTGLRDGLPISYNKIATYALQHLRDRRDSAINPNYDVNIFYNISNAGTEPQASIKSPLFTRVVGNGLAHLNTVGSYRISRPEHYAYPQCFGGSDPYDDTDIGYCNHRDAAFFEELVPHFIPYQLTYGLSLDWAPQDDCGHTNFSYRVMDNKFKVTYTPYDEGIPLDQRNDTPFVHLFNTNYLPTTGTNIKDSDGYLIGTGFRNLTNVAPDIRAPRSQVGFKIISSPIYAGSIDGYDIVKLNIPNHKLTAGEPLEIVGLGAYNGFYAVTKYGDSDTVAIRSNNHGVVIPNAASFLLLTDAYNWLATDPFEVIEFATRFQDITADATGIEANCGGFVSSSSSSSPIDYSALENYVYKVYVDNNGGDWPDYIDVNLFRDAVLVAIKEFGGQNRYFNDEWIRLEDQLGVAKDYFGNTRGTLPESIIRREVHDLASSIDDNNDLAELTIASNGDFKHGFLIGDRVVVELSGGTVDTLNGYDGEWTIIDASADTVTINAPYLVGGAPATGATIRLLAPFTFAGDLFNGVSLMLDTAFKALHNQDEIRTSNLASIRDWVSTAFFDNQQRLYEAIGALSDSIKSGFDTIDKKIKEEVALTPRSLLYIGDLSNEDGGISVPALEIAEANTLPDLSLVANIHPQGVIHRVIHDVAPRGVGSPEDLTNSVTANHWSFDLIGPFANMSQARVKVTNKVVDISSMNFNQIEDGGDLVVTNIPTIRNVEDTLFSVVSKTTTDNHINVTPQVTPDLTNSKLDMVSSYIPMSAINNILDHDVAYSYDSALPVTAVYADNLTPTNIRFDFNIKATNYKTGDALDFNDKVEYLIFGEHNGRYTDLTEYLAGDKSMWSSADRGLPSTSTTGDSPYLDARGLSRYEYRPQDGALIGDIAIDGSGLPVDFFDNTPDMYNILYKKIDIVLYYRAGATGLISSSSSSSVVETDTAQIPMVTIPLFIYRIQKKTTINIAYKKGIRFDRLLSDTAIDVPYTIVLADSADRIIGTAEVSLVDLANNSNRLLSIGQYVKMLEADIGVPGKFNTSVGLFYAAKSGSGNVFFTKTEQQKIIDAYNDGVLRRGQLFNVSFENQLDPWYLFNEIPANVTKASQLDIMAYIAPAIGNMYRGIREHNNAAAPYAQTDGLYNHINRFNNPHKVGKNSGVVMTYE